ncbi:MAG: YafY family protein [Eubacteriales bacterium]|nr:YafY family protein [Eubacteriales bacterium]HCA30726.1 transcriptional regulator [Oscillospiraceae bacterium]
MKIDRLIAITMYLLNRETVSASALAERFEVSKRTIQRDIEALNQSGIPIVSTFGSDGGYEIMDGFKLTKQIAGVDDYLNIIIALKGLSSAYDNEKINATLEKALATMQSSEQRVFIDFTVARENTQVNENLKMIEKAIYDENLLQIQYTNAEGAMTKRIVEPLALSYQWYAWYLFAYCTEKQDYRLFKLPRISECKPIDGSFSKKHENIEMLMKQESPDKRKWIHMKLLCKKEIRQQALEYLGKNIIETKENGDFIIENHAPFERMWFSLLLGFGNQVEVLEPEELKNMLKEKAEEILSNY